MLKYFPTIKRKVCAEITTVPDVLKGGYYQPIDGLRGIAILLVLAYHFGGNHFVKPLGIHFESRTGVNLFFVISGFLITTLLIKEKIKNGKISMRHFFIRRAIRIIPVLYLFLTVLIGLTLYYHLKVSTSDWISSFLFLKNLPLKTSNHPLTAHLWSLAVEMQFYIIFPFLLAVNINRYFIIALSIIIVVPSLSIFGCYYGGLHQLPFFIRFIIKISMYAFWNGPVMILIGSVFSILLFKGMLKTDWTAKAYVIGIVLFVMAIIIPSRAFIYYHKYISEYVSVLLLGYCTALSISSRDFLTTILKNRFLVGLGIISYSIYIWQELFIGTRPWEPWLSFWKGYPLYIFGILKLVCMLLIAFISYYFYESRFLNWKKRFK